MKHIKIMIFNSAEFKVFLFGLIMVIGLCSIAGLLAKIWWLFDLFNHLRPQALFSILVLFVMSLAVKDAKSIYLSFFILALNMAFITERLYAFPLAENSNRHTKHSGDAVSVIFSNVMKANNAHHRLLYMVGKHDPDIFVAAEVNEEWAASFKSLKNKYPYSIVTSRSDNFGMAVYSKVYFNPHQYEVGSYKLPLFVLEFDGFTMVALHPLPPVSKENNTELYAYLARVAEIVRYATKPIILVGDFNTTLWSENVNVMRGLGIKRTSNLGMAWTWPSGFFPFAMQIDHVFVKGVESASFDTLPDVGSDHFPLKSTIVIGEK